MAGEKLFKALGVDAGQPLWVFGYGSLMWLPGIAFDRRERGLLRGYHRKCCIYSWHYRGTPDQPGVVLGLASGGSCQGIVYRVPAEHVAEAADYLWEREMVTEVYRPRLLPVRLTGGDAEGEVVPACSFVANPRHPQYCGRLAPEAVAALVRNGVGSSGRCLEYLANTVVHLEELGIPDRSLQAIWHLARDDKFPADPGQS